MKITDLLEGVSNPVQFYPDLVHITGSHQAAIFLGQVLYWTGKQHNSDGWIYKTQEEWQLETELSEKEQKNARTKLTERFLVEERFVGIPRRLEYRANTNNINEAWEKWIPAMRLKKSIINALSEQSHLTKRGIKDSVLDEQIALLRKGLADCRKKGACPETIEKSIISQWAIMQSPTKGIRNLPQGDARIDHRAMQSIYTEITSEITSENLSFGNGQKKIQETPEFQEKTDRVELEAPSEKPISTPSASESLHKIKPPTNNSTPRVKGSAPAHVKTHQNNTNTDDDIVDAWMEDEGFHKFIADTHLAMTDYWRRSENVPQPKNGRGWIRKRKNNEAGRGEIQDQWELYQDAIANRVKSEAQIAPQPTPQQPPSQLQQVEDASREDKHATELKRYREKVNAKRRAQGLEELPDTVPDPTSPTFFEDVRASLRKITGQE
ncbi:MAG TPA: hypothetical protein V6D33_05555 [Cyanophyceae cyanobacterium]